MAASIRVAVAAALASAALLWAASPATGVGWLAWVALVPAATVVLATAGTRPARLTIPLAYGLLLLALMVPAFPFGLAEGQWGDPVLPVLVGDSPVLAIALVGIPLVGVLLYLIRFGEPWGAARLRGPAALAATVAVPALAWTALDFARANLDPGALWGPLFLSQAGESPGALATVGGPWLVTLAIVAVNYGIAAALVHRQIVVALVPAALALAGILWGTALERTDEALPSLRVAAVQPGYDTAERDRPELRRFRAGTYDLAALDLIGDLGELTREASRDGAEVVVWPEAAMYVDPREEPPVRRALTRLAGQTGAVLVVPFFLPSPVAAGEVLAVVPEPGGTAELTETRPKHDPLWYIGERRAAGETGPIEAGEVTLGVLFGTDTKDPGNAAALVSDGARLLASSTHDWRQSAVPARAYAQLAARAAEAPLVRADWRYGSAIYTADGTLAADAGHERDRTVLVADVRPGSPSPYARLGDLVAWAAVGGALLAALAALLARFAARGRLSRGGGRGGGGRAPRRGSPPRPPAREQPRGAGARTPPPP